MSLAPRRPSSLTPLTSPCSRGFRCPESWSCRRSGGGRALTGHADLPGRDEELQALDAAFLRARAGTPVTVVIEGEPGIGKTAVASTWTDRLGAETVVLAARCDQLSRSLPLQPVLHVVRNHLRRVGTDAGRELLGSDATLLEPMLDWTATNPGSRTPTLRRRNPLPPRGWR